jgi:broad specificity phosphatase PhoE
VRLVFETHSTSFDNLEGLASGHSDVDLSPRGEQEAATLGARRARDRFEVIYVSDLRRSWRTAEIAFGGAGIPIVRDRRLRECDYGSLTRSPSDEVAARQARAVLDPFPGGESYAQSTARVAEWLNEVTQQWSLLLVIGHRATHVALDHLILGVPLAQAVGSHFVWQPGWTYDIPDKSSPIGSGS